MVIVLFLHTFLCKAIVELFHILYAIQGSTYQKCMQKQLPIGNILFVTLMCIFYFLSFSILLLLRHFSIVLRLALKSLILPGCNLMLLLEKFSNNLQGFQYHYQQNKLLNQRYCVGFYSLLILAICSFLIFL